MPTVFRWKGYRFFWYEADGAEPPHVHIWKDGKECKIWLTELTIAFNRGHAPHEIRALVDITSTEQKRLLEVWNEHFGN